MTGPWFTPTEAEIKDAPVEQLRLKVNARWGLNLRSYWDLHRWTLENANEYWNLVWDEQTVLGTKGRQPLFDDTRPMNETKHLIPNARLNFAENALLSHRMADTDHRAVISCCEAPSSQSGDTHLRTLSWKELRAEVAQFANAMKQMGIGPGDRVAAFTPNNAEAVVFTLASSAIGAVSSTCAAEFGVSAVLERFEQIKPRLLLCADQYRYNGKTLPLLPKALDAAKTLQKYGLQRVVVVGQLDKAREPQIEMSASSVDITPYWAFLARQPDTIDFWRGPAMSPLWILFSSGTTGKPKAIVHSAGGMLLAAKALHAYSSSHRAGDCVFQYTTMSWMMAQCQPVHPSLAFYRKSTGLIMCLTSGSTILCYDGSPFSPMSLFWDLIDEHQITRLGASPRYMQVLLSNNYRPKDSHSLASLRSIGMTGAPMSPALYEYITDAVKPRIMLNNGSGGTDACCAFISSISTLPIWKGEISAPILGTSLEVWTEGPECGEVRPGIEGNMVITRPFVNMPLGFLGDDDGSRFRESYFDTYRPRIVWDHSDWLVRHPQTGGFTLLGRSDAVLNPAGVRFGSSEIYAAVEGHKDVVDDCIAVAQKLPDGDERVVLFIKTVEGRPLAQDSIDQIKRSIASRLSKRHVPAVILECPDIPYTATSKRIEVAVKKLINGSPLTKVNRHGMANPDSLSWFADRPELRLGDAKAKL